MLHVLNIETEHLHPRARKEMHELRFREFVEEQKYDTSSYRGMEFDAFDTPAATYLVYLSDVGRVIACSRLSPTSMPFMIARIWSTCTEQPIAGSDRVWESSRICIDDRVEDKAMRRRIVDSIVVAHLEFALANGIEKYVAIMPDKLWRHVFIDRDWPLTPLGAPFMLDGEESYVAEFAADETIFEAVRRKTGVRERVLGSW